MSTYICKHKSIVLELLEGLENKGYSVFCDNFYTSPSLFRHLQVLGFGACGTVKPELSSYMRLRKPGKGMPGPPWGWGHGWGRRRERRGLTGMQTSCDQVQRQPGSSSESADVEAEEPGPSQVQQGRGRGRGGRGRSTSIPNPGKHRTALKKALSLSAIVDASKEDHTLFLCSQENGMKCHKSMILPLILASSRDSKM